MTQVGININSHPDNSAKPGRPGDIKVMKDLGWVRLVFFYHAAVVPPENRLHFFSSSFDEAMQFHESDIQKCFQYYDGVIKSYNDLGVGVLIVLNQETFSGKGGRAPWNGNSWSDYATDFADFAGRIASRYKGKKVAYEIWNEEDLPPPKPGVAAASVPVTPENFALILSKLSAKIKANDPKAPVVFGGLLTGAGAAVEYVNKVKKALGGKLPVDAVGIHPYGQWVTAANKNIAAGWFGTLESTLKIFEAGIDKPLWVTEIGISEDHEVPQKFWAGIADYVDDALTVFAKHQARIPVVIWFAWSDIMRNAGITDKGGQPKSPIYKRFFDVAKRIKLTDNHDNKDDHPVASHLITVPWVSQLVNEVRFDGGHASVLMLMQFYHKANQETVTDLVHKMDSVRGTDSFKTNVSAFTTGFDLVHLAAAYGLTLTRQETVTVSELRPVLNQDKPVIVLLNYDLLGITNPSVVDPDFKQWVVVTGYKDGVFVVNDPIWTPQSRDGKGGTGLEIGAATLQEAVNKASTNHPILY